MITVETKVVQRTIKITTTTCDCCGHSVKNNKGCCGVRPIMTCDFCDDDCCRGCRDFYTEDTWADYPMGLWACSKCMPKAKEAWEWADMNAGRHDDIIEVTLSRFKELSVD